MPKEYQSEKLPIFDSQKSTKITRKLLKMSQSHLCRCVLSAPKDILLAKLKLLGTKWWNIYFLISIGWETIFWHLSLVPNEMTMTLLLVGTFHIKSIFYSDNCILYIVISANSTNFTTNTRYHVESSVDEPHRLQQQVLVLVSLGLGVLMSSMILDFSILDIDMDSNSLHRVWPYFGEKIIQDETRRM